jgi:dolichyl-phosphate-mannose--protein O-mannosyl transferase
VKQSINAIYDINMQAVVRKNQAVRRDSSRFMNSMAIIGSVCLALAVFYFWYFPVYISTTLSYLADKMRNLLKSAGIAFDDTTKDEAYVMLHAISLLENRLAEKREGEG